MSPRHSREAEYRLRSHVAEAQVANSDGLIDFWTTRAQRWEEQAERERELHLAAETMNSTLRKRVKFAEKISYDLVDQRVRAERRALGHAAAADAWEKRLRISETAKATVIDQRVRADKRALDAETRLASFYSKVTNPPITMVKIDYEERWIKAESHLTETLASLKRFTRLLGRLYWRHKPVEQDY